MKIHYENNTPFLTISSITRTIEVSHWGNIAVEETIDLRHTGAVLKGPFSRYDYQRQSDSGISSVKSFKVLYYTQTTVVGPVFTVKVMVMTPYVFSFRLSSLLRPRMSTTEMRLATSLRPICRFWMTQWRWRSDLDSPCLEAGRPITSSATICPATSTSTPWVSWFLITLTWRKC